MKNAFKLAVVALVISVSAVACGGDAKKGENDTTTVVSDSTTVTKTIDSTKTDTVVVDSAKKDSIK